jgi:four helix bundle protein
MSDSILRDKSYAFAVRIINLSKHLAEKKKEYILSKQVLRSGTAIGASINEATYAESNADFIHKLSISLKEAQETHYWFSLLKDTDYITPMMFDSINSDCEELIKMLIASIKTSKNK